MNYYTAKDILKIYINNKEKRDPAELLSNDWKVKINVNKVFITSERLSISLQLTLRKYNQMIEKECDFKTFTSIGFVSQEDFFLAQDTIDLSESQRIKYKDLDNLSIVEDIKGDIYLILKDKIVHRDISRNSFSGYKDKESFTYEINIPAIKINKKQFESALKYDETFFYSVSQHDLISSTDINKILFNNILNIKKEFILKSLKQLFRFNFIHNSNVSIHLEDYEDLSITNVALDPRRFNQNLAPNSAVQNFIEDYDKGGLVFISNEHYIKKIEFSGDIDYNNGSFYIREQSILTGKTYLIKIIDINKFKDRLSEKLDYVDDLFDADDIFKLVDLEKYTIIPIVFI